MNDSSGASKAQASTPPSCWSVDRTETGVMRLTFAVRGGIKQYVLVALGAALLLAGCYAIYWLLAGGELTVAGFVFLLAPAGVALFGVYVLDIALLARTTYILESGLFAWRRHSLFGDKSLEIPRQQIKGLSQHYSPPGPSQPQGHPGSWTTFISYEIVGSRKPRDLAIDGLSTPEEARWLGALLTQWSGLWLQRGFAASYVEADGAELPDLQDAQEGS
jgi:hypothetical protein